MIDLNFIMSIITLNINYLNKQPKSKAEIIRLDYKARS